MQALQYPNAWVNRKVYNWMMELKRKWSVAYQLFLEPFLQYILLRFWNVEFVYINNNDAFLYLTLSDLQ